MHAFRKQWLLGCAAFSALSFAAVHAQAADALQADSSKATQVGEVVVTATRRSERVQNVGGEVTALTNADLEKTHAQDLTDFATSVPGLSFQSNSPTNNLVAIRGVASSTAELGSAVAIYLDDVPLGASTQFGLGSQAFNFNLFDMDRVEVLNGPQGTLYGANALGGALKYVTQRPDPSGFYGLAELDGSHTEHGGWNEGARLMANMPLSDTAAFRVDLLQSFDSGWTQDPDHGRRNVGSARTWGGRVSFEDKLTQDLDVRLSFFDQDIKGSGQNVAFRSLQTHQPIEGTYDQSFALPQPEDNSVWLASGQINYDMQWAKLTSITAYQKNHGYYENDVSGFYDIIIPIYTGDPLTYFDPYDLYVKTDTDKFTQELRIASPDNKSLEWVAGAYYTHEITDETVNLLDTNNPGGLLPAPFSSLPFEGYLPSRYQEIAAFGDATWFITDSFDVTLGVRYSHQHQRYSSYLGWVGFGPPFGQVYPYSSTSDQGVTTFLFNPRWRITPDTMVYARVSSGFRPGGPNFVLPPAFNSPAPSAFSPDKIWNYEIGEKSTFWDHRATFDFDVYDIEWKGIQTTQNVNGINQLVNAGDARIQGAEMSFSYRVTSPFTVRGSAAYTDAQLTTAAPVLGVFYTGARLPLSPKYNFAVDGNYNFDWGANHGWVNVQDVWVGDRTSGYAGSPTNVLYKMGAYNTVNLNAAIVFPDNIEIDGYVRNLFDVRGELGANTLNNVFNPFAGVPVVLSQPRTIGLVLKVPFGGK
ncbi:MAG TPA: TonB-dependent receptor [Caulobacteraceae bacterium]|nr:TonB-dependent receptor [Caulobacteraceae bacterium]